MFPLARGFCRRHASNLKLLSMAPQVCYRNFKFKAGYLKTNIYQNSFDPEVRTRGCRKRLPMPESELPTIMINFACPRQESDFMAALHRCNRLDLCGICHIRMDITDKPCPPHSSVK
jgi:hypothetical protein